MHCSVREVLLDVEGRQRHFAEKLRIEGLSQEENPLGCYSAIPLSDVPPAIRRMLLYDHSVLKEAISHAGITVYDPGDAPFNPQLGINDDPDKVYALDTLKVAGARFFTFTNYAGSTGAGIEQEKAHDLVKPSVTFVRGDGNTGIYVSRMSTGMDRSLVVEFGDPHKVARRITELFQALREFEPGVGTCEHHGNVLLGFQGDRDPVCMKGFFEEEFPDLQYNFEKFKDKS